MPPDRGSASVLVLAAAAGALVLAAAAAAAGQVAAAGARAASTADAAALGGAAAAAVGGSGCGRAHQVAGAAGGELVGCSLSQTAAGPVVDVVVAVRPVGLVGSAVPVTARARAGAAP
ncbi:helicase [Quadrisphaera setariae]|uniref:Helicase n=1 Tax=Quadrisphaera setariae TaxID=2593304 RepID=A0A5C8Z624_9ACTN|nr:helicase [Quadrisphaera setariae]